MILLKPQFIFFLTSCMIHYTHFIFYKILINLILIHLCFFEQNSCNQSRIENMYVTNIGQFVVVPILFCIFFIVYPWDTRLPEG